MHLTLSFSGDDPQLQFLLSIFPCLWHFWEGLESTVLKMSADSEPNNCLVRIILYRIILIFEHSYPDFGTIMYYNHHRHTYQT